MGLSLAGEWPGLTLHSHVPMQLHGSADHENLSQDKASFFPPLLPHDIPLEIHIIFNNKHPSSAEATESIYRGRVSSGG